MQYHQWLSVKTLLQMVTTSHRISESIELDSRARYAIMTEHPAMFEVEVTLNNPGAPGTRKVEFVFDQSRGLVCDAETFRALSEADLVRRRLTFIEIASGDEIFAKPPKLDAFTPNGKPTPTLKEAFEAIDKLPPQTGNFGRRQDGFQPNTSKKAAPSSVEKVAGLPAFLLDTAAGKPGALAKIPEGKEAFDYLNEGCYWEEGQEGFWRERGSRMLSRNDTLPFPVVQKCRGYNKAEFLLALDNVQFKIKPKVFRGMSPNRWTGEFNGCAEFQVDNWKWPEGYRTYIVGGVLPSREFYNFITGKTLKGLPSFAKQD